MADAPQPFEEIKGTHSRHLFFCEVELCHKLTTLSTQQSKTPLSVVAGVVIKGSTTIILLLLFGGLEDRTPVSRLSVASSSMASVSASFHPSQRHSTARVTAAFPTALSGNHHHDLPSHLTMIVAQYTF